MFLAAVTAIFNLTLKHYNLYFNVSNSLPIGLYKKVDLSTSPNGTSLKHNDIVLFCLSEGESKFAFERGYIDFGSCPGGYAPLGKYVVALKGDNVIFDPKNGIFVNGKLVNNSFAQHSDNYGRPLKVFSGSFILNDQDIVVANPKIDSFDSRYFGPINYGNVLGVITPFYTWDNL